ncbi:hypothetical protein GDO78_015880 [Eleutherodactylus coqui]|uniref:Uncharacterized protein n=1 Tax=Eleutherodactylus coqui TaxID=57060 RepID=A0A8J6E8F9_ELECQ|nr:hypothetical protein GDO78_015880 [Eleutherodactylus coqui]
MAHSPPLCNTPIRLTVHSSALACIGSLWSSTLPWSAWGSFLANLARFAAESLCQSVVGMCCLLTGTILDLPAAGFSPSLLWSFQRVIALQAFRKGLSLSAVMSCRFRVTSDHDSRMLANAYYALSMNSSPHIPIPVRPRSGGG